MMVAEWRAGAVVLSDDQKSCADNDPTMQRGFDRLHARPINMTMQPRAAIPVLYTSFVFFPRSRSLGSITKSRTRAPPRALDPAR